jgi:glycosyltransferase involved in cell wall biosynthesis
MNHESHPKASARAAFVVEQTLGHVTHFRNLRDFMAQQSAVLPVMLPIPFETRGLAGRMPLFRSNWSVRASWRARRALETARATCHLDAIVFHTQVTALFSQSLMRDIPSIISLDATPINYDSVGAHYGHRGAGGSLVDQQAYRLNRNAFHAAARLVAWSEWARRSLIHDYGVDAERIRVHAPGAAGEFFDIGRARLGAADATQRGRPVRLLFVGGDFERKGGPALLECVRGALANRCELHLVTNARVQAQPGVFVHKNLGPNSAALRQLYAEADVFVLPTNADCLAVVLMEATAAALPVITTNVGALPEAVRPGESGLLIPAGDTAALASALSSLVDDAQQRRRLGRAAHALAVEKFDAHRNNRALLDLVLDLTQARNDSRRAA